MGMAPRNIRSMLLNWVPGAIVGTLIVAATSPWFVRSYAPLQADELRQTWTLPPGHTYRWRSEGYANTQIGPHGMPGRTTLPAPGGDDVRVALWGDSQAEGVCVHDWQKLFAQSESIAADDFVVLPLTRSGEDAADWVTQIPLVEPSLQIDAHVLLVVELSDLQAAVAAPLPPPSDTDVAAANAAIAARLPAFVIQAARHLLTESDDVTRRRLRFGIGPIAETPVAVESAAEAIDWLPPLRALRDSTDRPIVLLYAPKVPQIVEGRIVRTDPDSESFAVMQSKAESIGIVVVDARTELQQSAESGHWPHGFHNGQIGAGHLNPRGYAVIASLLVDAVEQATR